MNLYQGDLFWLSLPQPGSSAATHPHVVIQDNVLNHSRIETVVVCALTTRLALANEPGNILLDPGEGNLPRQSVIVVSQLSSVSKTLLTQPIGQLSPTRIEQIWEGLRFQQKAFRERSSFWE